VLFAGALEETSNPHSSAEKECSEWNQRPTAPVVIAPSSTTYTMVIAVCRPNLYLRTQARSGSCINGIEVVDLASDLQALRLLAPKGPEGKPGDGCPIQ
jgi:hypothetical protein